MHLPIIDDMKGSPLGDRGSDDEDDAPSVFPNESDEFSREKMLALEHENAALRAEIASLASVRLVAQHRIASMSACAALLDGATPESSATTDTDVQAPSAGFGDSPSQQLRLSMDDASARLYRMAAAAAAVASGVSVGSPDGDSEMASGGPADDKVYLFCRLYGVPLGPYSYVGAT